LAFDSAFLIFGHRGAAGLEPENTLRSFLRAINLGVDAVELDIRLKDGRLLVTHDDTVHRCTNGSGSLAELKLDQIRTLDAGKGENIPFLEEVFHHLPQSVAINIEIKTTPRVNETVLALTKVIANFPGVPVLVSSFQHEALECFRQHDKKTKVAPLYHRAKHDMLETASKLSAWSINISRKIVSQKLIAEIQNSGFKTYVWTVNKTEEARRFKSWGVDGVMTDYPDRLVSMPGKNP